MTKINKTALSRKFAAVDDGIVRRGTPVNSFPSAQKPCPVCGKPMFLSMGQIAQSHGGECRKLRRNAKMRFGQ